MRIFPENIRVIPQKGTYRAFATFSEDGTLERGERATAKVDVETDVHGILDVDDALLIAAKAGKTVRIEGDGGTSSIEVGESIVTVGGSMSVEHLLLGGIIQMEYMGVVDGSGIILPQGSLAGDRFLHAYIGESVGAVTNNLEVPSGHTLVYRDSQTGSFVTKTAGQTLDIYNRAVFLVSYGTKYLMIGAW